MLMENMNWMQVEEYLKKDDRIILAIGSVEQHGYNDVFTDTKCAWEIAKAACEKTGVLLAPAINYSFAGWVDSFPGTVNIKPETLMATIRDILESLTGQGFKRILIVNGHGQNEAAAKLVIEELSVKNPDLNVKFRSWYMLPKVYEIISAEGATYWDHASWLESFPWINWPPGVEIPDKVKTSVLDDYDYVSRGPMRNKAVLGDGVAGSAYRKDEKFMREYFQVAVDEVVDILEGSWEKRPTYAE